MKPKRLVVLIFALVIILFSLLLYRSVTAEPDAQYYSNSIQMDGTYDFDASMFSWNPALLPGYNIDTSNIYCVGAVRVNISTFKCVEPYQWYYEPLDGKYYLTASLNMGQLCGMENVMLQPFLDVYNPTTGAHDRIYGNTEIVDYSPCGDSILPIIMNDSTAGGNSAYPAPQMQESSMSKKSKIKGTPYP